MMVVDTSVLLAILFREKEGPWCVTQLEGRADLLSMSTVNLTELLIIMLDRQPQLFEGLQQLLGDFDIRYTPPSESQARIAALARLKYPKLNFGDCFAYALAKEENSPILTLDADFRQTDVPIIFPE